jgi:thiol-disulfide isomerase/thioredoxin
VQALKHGGIVAGVLALLCTGGCGDDGGTAAPQPGSRVVAVQARESTRTPAEMCDVFPDASAAPRFAMPELAESISMREDDWRWVNVWATWCQPCIEEIPTLVAWEERLGREGKPIDLVLLSADADAEAVAAFRQRVPTLPESARMADPNAVEGWVGGLGMRGGASLPIQIFVDPQGRARCVRAGAVNDEDYGAIAQLVGR